MVEQSPVELVVKAIQALPDGDRDKALAWLIERNAPNWGAAVARARPPRATGTEPAEPGPALPSPALSRRLGEYASLHGEHQGILVRLPVEQHTRLRTWCAAHGFSMATVVRGLVDRFLDQQSPAGDEPGDQPGGEPGGEPGRRDAG
jgi:hypothetical protein